MVMLVAVGRASGHKGNSMNTLTAIKTSKADIKISNTKIKGALLLTLCIAAPAWSHGLIENPASRNQFCGVITKPDQAANGTGQYLVCNDAFVNDQEGGYSFMSVLTHAQGRKQVTPLPDNVCGFDSEVWDGGATPWDSAIDWPTNTMQSGRNEITWNISWGPHFDDTEEFVYWITKEEFVFDPDTPLAWSDFEATPFCDLTYDDSQPNANPDVMADKPANKFYTYCTIPERTGRHVIYGEWGRNFFTYERFHGCIDAVFTDDNADLIDAKIVATPDNTTLIGAGAITLDATSSLGDNLTYEWSLNASDDSVYALSSTTDPIVQLAYANPLNADEVTVLLSVTNNNGTDVATYQFEHLPTANSTWKLAGPLTPSALTLAENDAVSLRVVDSAGQDNYIPAQPLLITNANNAANVWPYELAQEVNSDSSNNVAIGILNPDGDIVPAQTATSNNIYTRVSANIAGVYLNITNSQTNQCEFIVTNSWETGYVATIRINNPSDTAINGWQVNWHLTNSQITDWWNANLTTGTQNSASNLVWNSNIAPNSYVEFGFSASKADGAIIETPVIFGSVCTQ
ncbi:chemotaxis protein [Marinomonas agarivorans]|nr:chemotaxis protein [Marinomonas agarivorans]